MFRVGLQAYREITADRPVIINSTTAEDSKLQPLLEMAVQYKAAILGVVMDERGSPQDVDRRVELGAKIFGAAVEAGIATDDIILDPIIMPLKFMQEQAKNVLEAIQQLTMLSDPPPHISIGLSNISSKAEERKLINRIMMVMAMARGVDTAILDVSDEDLMNAVAAAELIMNKEIYSDGFLKTRGKMSGASAGANA
jgi:5-methyltetrahydrofolate corrinoid/iron sulfur protein methyltransferase